MKKILVVIDMQNDFTTGVLGNERCAAVIPKVVERIRSGEYAHCIFTKDSHTGAYPMTQEGRKLPVAHCLTGTKGWEIVPEIEKAAKEQFAPEQMETICKPSFGSLELGTRLKKLREEEGKLEIHFCGVCTGICVISNVMITKAALPEEKVCVLERACACVTEESHMTAVEAMKTCQVDVL